MPTFTARVHADDLLLHLSEMPDGVHRALMAAMQRETIATARLAKEKVSGPVLKNRTGTLRRKIHGEVTTDAGKTQVVGHVGLKLAYAAAHEYGFDGVVTVREHLRTVTQAFGRPISPVEVMVRSHDAHLRIPERSYLRSSLRDRRQTIVDELRGAVASAVHRESAA